MTELSKEKLIELLKEGNRLHEIAFAGLDEIAVMKTVMAFLDNLSQEAIAMIAIMEKRDPMEVFSEYKNKISEIIEPYGDSKGGVVKMVAMSCLMSFGSIGVMIDVMEKTQSKDTNKWTKFSTPPK